MSDSNEYSTDDEPVQEAMAIDTDDEEDQAEAAQVLEPEVEEASPETEDHGSYDADVSVDLVPSQETHDHDEHTDGDQHDSDSTEDHEEDDGVMAAVVLEDEADAETEVAQAEVVEAVEVETGNDQAIAEALEKDMNEEGDVSKSKKKTVRKVKKHKKKKGKRSRTQQGNWGGVAPERLDAAADARDMLLNTVPRLPIVVSDSHVVRSFGRLHVQDSLESPFSSLSALFPVGFSCDRFEFSPVHGRVLKLRCSILDGSKFSEKDGSPPAPVFRVMWGQGVDDDSDALDYPYDPYTASTPIAGGDQVDAVALPFSDEGSSTTVLPEVGMRVKVRFEEDEWYGGTILHVGDEEVDKKSKRKHVEICIQYDDGSTEDATFPDSDIKLNLPGDEDEAAEKGVTDISELHGKPVTSVSGGSPIEAWGKALLELGLIDEIIFDSAMEALTTSRQEGRAEAMGKIQAQKLQRQQARLKSQQKQSGEGEPDEEVGLASSPKSQLSDTAASPEPSGSTRDAEKDVDKNLNDEAPDQLADVDTEGENQEEATDKELELCSKLDTLRQELDELQDQDRDALIALTDARISKIGPLLCNPFRENDPEFAQQAAWLAAVIRKEKAKMGSTGNRKKVVTRTDLLERNDTFYNGEIERLLEGLPGSEYCPSYVFQEFRSGGAAALSQAWVHEAEIRQQKERERHLKSVKEAKAKASQQREREIKKRKREEVRDARKREKLEEAEIKKKARVEDRLSRLSVQVDERLFKEACFQREKVVLILSKALGKEFARRRKAAELVSGNMVMNTKRKNKNKNIIHLEDSDSGDGLPPLSQVYDEHVLRVWDFVTSFGSAFTNLGFMSALPTLDSLQSAIDSIRNQGEAQGKSKEKVSKAKAVDSLTKLAVALSKPLAASLTKLLFSSLIALNPGLQKDYGASFFAEVNATSKEFANSKDENGRPSLPGLLPVNNLTWREIARVAFLSDSLGELGCSRQETAHLLRGYRSGGHPNSKEAKRLRRTEDFSIALLRQIIAQASEGPQAMQGDQKCGKHRILVSVPSKPSSCCFDWMFHVHNVKALPSTAPTAIKTHISRAVDLLKSDANVDGADSILADLNKCLRLLDKVEKPDQPGPNDVSACSKAKTAALRVLDGFTHETFSKDVHGQVVYRNAVEGIRANEEGLSEALCPSHKLARQRMGLMHSLRLTSQQYKDFVHAREEYVADALRLKEDMDRKQKKAEGDEAEEDDDDDDDDDDENGNAEKPKSSENEEDDTSGSQKEKSGHETKDVSNKSESGIEVEGASEDEHKNKKAESEKSSANAPSEEVVTAIVENGEESKAAESSSETKRIGRPTEFDDFCADMPEAHELIRRCLAVLRTLCQTGPAEPFVYPVDPQEYPGYYEALLKPMCLREVGKYLQDAGMVVVDPDDPHWKEHSQHVEGVVAQFGRNVRMINQNCSSYSNVGASIISSAEEMLRIFERLFLDWVLAPEHMLPPLESLDDDRCVEYHPSDEDSLVLLCDGCEGKYNMNRLDPPLAEVPKGDWFCPRCLKGRCFADLDPRIGKKVPRNCSEGQEAAGSTGVIDRCQFRFTEDEGSKPSLMYVVRYEDDAEELWTLDDIDNALVKTGDSVPPVRCLEAVAESPGYGLGIDNGLQANLVPVPLNPGVSDAASQAALSSSVFRDTIAGSSSLLLLSPNEMSYSEWSRLLILLTTKCASSEMMLGLASKLENQAAQDMAEQLSSLGKVSLVTEILPSVTNLEEATEIENDSSKQFGSEQAVSTSESKSGSQLGKRKAVSNGHESSAPVVDADSTDDVIVEANDVEVVAEVEETKNAATEDVMGTAPAAVVSSDALNVVSNAEVPEEDTRKKERFAALSENEKRRKAREDSIVAYCIKNQLRSVVASFEEDAVSQVVDSTLTSAEVGLSLSASRCRGLTCYFCGLSDVALGSPLLRVPDEEEWNDIMPHAFRSRRIYLVADTGNLQGNEETEDAADSVASPRVWSRTRNEKKLVSVSLRVGGEVFSNKEEREYFEDMDDGGMLQLLPRNAHGFQMELQFRADAGLPFVSGSLSAHECCAIAAHDARKEQVVLDYKENRSALVERDCGMTCGRTLSLGKDEMGRSFWKFHSDRSSLFVCLNYSAPFNATPDRKWHRYRKAEDIASVIVALGKQEVGREVKRAFPESARMVKSGKWSYLLQKRFLSSKTAAKEESNGTSSPKKAKEIKRSSDANGTSDTSSEDEDEPYEEGEDVLVESNSGNLLWGATVIAVSRSRDTNKVTGYRVRYTNWSSRFDEWVEPVRVVEPIDNNLRVQEELLEEHNRYTENVPPSLKKLVALGFLSTPYRSRGASEPPNFTSVAHVGPGDSFEDENLAVLKAALLLVEASLPLGSIDNSESGPWRPVMAAQWRSQVANAKGPSSLMRCMVLMEDALSPEWLDEKVGHMLSCLPLRWKAVSEASTSSLALRIFVIDRGIKYGVVDKQRYSSPRRKK